jgi:hypothetical protein
MSYVYLLTDKNKKCYVGKTENIRNRLLDHKKNIKNKRGCSSKKLDSDFEYEILEEYGNEWDLAKGEQKWYDIYKEKCGELLCNNRRPLNTQIEYYTQSKAEINKRQKDYIEKHKDEIKERNKRHYEQHKDEIKERNKQHYEQHKDKIKQYNEQHKDEIKERNKQYYEQHKLYRSEKYICDCGGTYDKSSKSRHFKTNKHIEYNKGN